jgi:flagellar basal-body rod modification protein FlgD
MATAAPVNSSTTNPFAAATTSTAANTVASANSQKNDAGTADRFLKLLVTQLQNQDPLNPMDNAQVTSQMAQINTVNGIEKLNVTVQGLNAQFTQMQALQGAALVGHDITVQGNRIETHDGQAVGGFELANVADAVKVEVLDGSGRVVDTLLFGAETAGNHSFNWQPGKDAAGKELADGSAFTFRVSATSGANAVATTPLMRDRVMAVSTTATGLVLQTLHNGDVPYKAVKAFN